MTEENKELARTLIEEVWGKGNLGLTADLLTDDFVGHVSGEPTPLRGPEAVRSWVAQWRAAFPDVRVTVEDEIAEGDKVVSRITATGTHQHELMGMPATGRSVTVAAIAIERFSGGKLAEVWTMFDLAGLLRQIGALP